MTETKKPTLLVLASTYPRWRNDHEPGFVHELSRRLVKRFNVIALVPDSPGADPDGEFDGVEVIRYRYAPRKLQTLVYNGGIATNLQRNTWKWLLVPLFILGQYLAARKVIKQRKIDVVHAHWLIPQGLIAKRLKKLAGIPFLVTSHGGDLFGLKSKPLTALKRRVAKAASGMTVVSSAMQTEAKRIGLRPPRTSVLPMGVDMQDRFVPNQAVERIPDQLFFVGRLVPKKGLSYLLDAMPAILAKRPNTTLTIAGFGPVEEELKAQAKRLNIESKIRFLGAVPQTDLPDHFHRASLFVAPFVREASGNQEGLPVVLMEAIGCGCPVVVGNVPGVEDLLGDYIDDVTVEPGNVQALSQAVIAALEEPEKTLEQAQEIRKSACEWIDWEAIANGYAERLEDCLATLK